MSEKIRANDAHVRFRRCPQCGRKFRAAGYRTYCEDCKVWIQGKPDPEWLREVKY